MLGTRQVSDRQTRTYATGGDFCRIFKKDMNRLYRLLFLLTGNHTIAVKCFVGGLDESGQSSPVFKEWAESWARRTIIRKAIQMIQPRPTGSGTTSTASEPSVGHATTELPESAGIVELPAFERFVFVMSVLERYSDQECSLLLECARADVSAARTRALRQFGRSAELHRRLTSIASDKALPENPESAMQLAISHLPASA